MKNVAVGNSKYLSPFPHSTGRQLDRQNRRSSRPKKSPMPEV